MIPILVFAAGVVLGVAKGWGFALAYYAGIVAGGLIESWIQTQHKRQRSEVRDIAERSE